MSDSHWYQRQQRDEARKEVLQAVERFIAENGHSPTRGEIAEATGMALITVRRHIKTLVDEGQLLEGRGHRTLRIAE